MVRISCNFCRKTLLEETVALQLAQIAGSCGQGFLFCRPMSIDQPFEMIEKTSVARNWGEV